MKPLTKLAGGLIVIASVGAVGVGAAAAAGDGDTTGATGARGRPTKEYVCEHPDEVTSRLQGRIDRLDTAIARLTERRAAAETAGHDRVVARIDKVLARADSLLTRAQGRLDKLPEWIAANC